MNGKSVQREYLRISILADSLALPRPEEAGDVSYIETYPFRLQQFLDRALSGRCTSLVHEKAERRCTMPDVVRDWKEEVLLKKPDAVVVHVGVVDCAPRVFTPFERRVIQRLQPMWLRDVVLRFTKRYRPAIVQLRRNIVYTPLSAFKEAVESIVEMAADAELLALLFVKIVLPPATLESRSPSFTENVRRCNQILAQVADGERVHLVDLDQIVHVGEASLTLLTTAFISVERVTKCSPVNWVPAL
jgi:hypothetical protein